MSRFRAACAAFVVCCAVAWTGPAAAADAPPSPRAMELSRQLFAAMHMNRTMDRMMQAMMPAITKQLETSSPEAAKLHAAVADSLADVMRDVMVRVQDKMIPIYASTFTEQELTDMVAFYEGPTGQSMIEKLPAVSAKLAPLVMEEMPGMMKQMQDRVCAKTTCPTQPAKP